METGAVRAGGRGVFNDRDRRVFGAEGHIGKRSGSGIDIDICRRGFICGLAFGVGRIGPATGGERKGEKSGDRRLA